MRHFLLIMKLSFQASVKNCNHFPTRACSSFKTDCKFDFAFCFPTPKIRKLPQNCTYHFPPFLHTHLCFTAGQVSESLQVRIVAGRPIHCQVPGIDHHLVKWAAVRATLEAAKAIALSHLGTLYIAETDERRINRIQQVRAQNL